MTTETEPQAPADGADGVPREGDVLAGKFRIERVLGQGGMGVVVAAEHTTLRQRVAVKFLLPEAMARADACDRFLREARAAVAIRSEHVARVTDVGTLESGAPYMVMELLSGTDLGVHVQQRGALPVQEAVDYVLQAGEAIAEAHSLGIVHRDLKPANLFLTARADGSSLIKVLDFGLSKAPKNDAGDASLTAANVIMGSPFYMSPEQVRGLKGLDARSDIWSLGVILYQLLTGVRPFEAEGLGVLFLMIGADPVAPLTSHRPDVPPALEAAVLACLEKDPGKRTQSMADLARALAPFGSADSRTSVERIQRVLSADATVPGIAGVSTRPAAPTGDPATDPTVALADALPVVPAGIKSSSMAGVASSVPEASGRRGVVIGLVAALALGAIVLASFRPRTPAGDPRPAATAPSASASASAVSSSSSASVRPAAPPPRQGN